MYREQRSLCAYCERSIEEGNPVPRIDHWRPLSLSHDVALHWSNLYLTCATNDTCDAAKADRPFKWADADPDLPWPTDFQYERAIGFTSRGEIYVRNDVNLEESRTRALRLAIDDQPDGVRSRAAILNLNHPALVAARSASIDSERIRLERDFRNETATREQRQERAAAMLAMNPLPQFVSIRVLWLRKQMGRGR
jgi:uncharacterized protein (TIGR02646 family)